MRIVAGLWRGCPLQQMANLLQRSGRQIRRRSTCTVATRRGPEAFLSGESRPERADCQGAAVSRTAGCGRSARVPARKRI